MAAGDSVLQAFILPLLLGIIGAAIPVVPVLYRTIRGQQALQKKLEAQAELIASQTDVNAIEAAQKSYTLLSESYRAVEERLKHYNDHLAQVVAERDAAQQEAQGLRGLRDEVVAMRTALSAESTRVAALSAEVEALRCQRQQEQEELQRARADLTEVLAQREQQALRIKRLEADYQAANRRVRELQKRVTVLERENADAVGRIEQLEETNRTLSAENASLKRPKA